ncbi:L-fuculose-phosphate aldolase [Paenibacillus cellulosilyticus]|uniref:L-fuculose-phosphate aldolase n=1 Tax=Paenibacillus cellulosilyticus TaxID=375489 RepID=A0A2V2YV14_9BACL|nr:class II aldolase/adducin family protein [Paenibacillus cellulosilyticus]PWV99751.1 L-fuculose-phosphate aldolase [Paenibacillus cellulosilyticus]QKS44822.1 class II aldolase/adducin family protein [Paenibacillus cellulosilyticus]
MSRSSFDIEEAKQRVVAAGIRLVDSGLIARTWGNVSHRISHEQFVITPSGRDYRSLTPDDIVTVQIADGAYSGSIKPSSERGAHAAVYRQFPDVNFVIHTHQTEASVISASGFNSVVLAEGPLAGEVLCGAYALPSTKKLARNIASSLANTTSRAVIMKNHGAICYGVNDEEAFNVALALESGCQRFLADVYRQLSGDTHAEPAAISQFVLAGDMRQDAMSRGDGPFYNSRRIENGFVLSQESPREEIMIRFDERNSCAPEEAQLHEAIYQKHKHVQYVTWNRSPEVVAFSQTNLKLKPLLDDFAQLIGTSARVSDADPAAVVAALGRSSAVFIRGRGALCCGSTQEDAAAVSMVLDKNCKAHIGASLLGTVKPIHYWESLLMRFVYLKQYSKQATKPSR